MAWRTISMFVLVAVLAGAAGAWFSMAREQPAGPPQSGDELLGQPRPPFTLGASDGRTLSAHDFDGRVLLINFWATWCTPCRAEMPMLNELYAELGDAGLSIAGVAIDDVQRARDFALGLGIEYTILVGATDVMATSLAYGNRAGMLPYTVLVDREGIVRWTRLGEVKRDELLEQIQPLL
jgi:thiol-disulfide isomerase/thioredoxin